MRLTAEKHPETIKRYAHLKAVRGWRTDPCAARDPGGARLCTREEGHRGPHAAHGRFGKVIAVWDGGRAPGRAAATVEHGRGRGAHPKGSPVGLRKDPRERTLRRLLAQSLRGTSVEDVAMIILFVAFVWFAIDWMMMIMG